MAHLFAQVVLPYFSNLPKDVAVNTFHFDTEGPNVLDDAEEVAQRLEIFYNESGKSGVHGLYYYLSPVIKRTNNACTIKVFNMGDPKPRQPILQETFKLEAATNTDGLPLEVAAVLSAQGDRVSGETQRRRRGRIFLGPLNAAAVTMGTSSTMPVLASSFIDALGASGQLLATAGSWNVRWNVYSRVNTDLVLITNGWVDNDFDTQRSRGPRATSRNPWSIVLP